MFRSGTVLGQGEHMRRWYRGGIGLVPKGRRFSAQGQVGLKTVILLAGPVQKGFLLEQILT
jgi:hypothetical protein